MAKKWPHLLSFPCACSFTLWICPFFYQKMESFSHSLPSSLALTLALVNRCGRNDVGVLSPSYKRTCWFVLSLSLADQTARWRSPTLHSWEREATWRKRPSQQPALTTRHMSKRHIRSSRPSRVTGWLQSHNSRQNWQKDPPTEPSRFFNSRNLSK